MRKGLVLTVTLCALFANLIAQTTPQGQRPRETPADDVIRITTDLVQTDVVVADKNDEIIPDLKLSDFEVYDNGKKQDLQFMEFISVSDDSRSEGTGVARIAPGIEAHVATDTTAADLRRVIGFVVDDVTIPSEDMSRVRELLLNFIDNQMRNGDLVAIVRTVGGRGLLEQFTADRQILKRAVNQLGVRSIPPHLAFGGEDPGRIISTPAPFGDATATDTVTVSSEGPTEGTNQIPRAVLIIRVEPGC
jgi:VWFA-related protein